MTCTHRSSWHSYHVTQRGNGRLTVGSSAMGDNQKQPVSRNTVRLSEEKGPSLWLDFRHNICFFSCFLEITLFDIVNRRQKPFLCLVVLNGQREWGLLCEQYRFRATWKGATLPTDQDAAWPTQPIPMRLETVSTVQK